MEASLLGNISTQVAGQTYYSQTAYFVLIELIMLLLELPLS